MTNNKFLNQSKVFFTRKKGVPPSKLSNIIWPIEKEYCKKKLKKFEKNLEIECLIIYLKYYLQQDAFCRTSQQVNSYSKINLYKNL